MRGTANLRGSQDVEVEKFVEKQDTLVQDVDGQWIRCRKLRSRMIWWSVERGRNGDG